MPPNRSPELLFEYKSYLFTIAYNITGDVGTSEDLVQDTFEKWLEEDRSDIKNVKGYLSKMIVNKAIDCLEKQAREREAYKGLWLPEPLVTENPIPESNYTLDYATLFLLEKLNPYERAVFVLREVFEHSYEEIAEFIETTNENCRQIFHRAKGKITVSEVKKKYDTSRQKELMEAFFNAIYEEDMEKLKRLFKEDIVLYSDGGGKAVAPLKALMGISKVSKFLITVKNLEGSDFSYVPVLVNGGFGVAIFDGVKFDSVVCIELEDSEITEIYLIRNPDKIKYFS